jgi:hypothetical protein
MRFWVPIVAKHITLSTDVLTAGASPGWSLGDVSSPDELFGFGAMSDEHDISASMPKPSAIMLIILFFINTSCSLQ